MADIYQIVLPDGTTCNITAAKIGTTDVGNYGNPIYLDDGVPTACTAIRMPHISVPGTGQNAYAVALGKDENDNGEISVIGTDGGFANIRKSGDGGTILLQYPSATTANKIRVQISAAVGAGSIYLNDSNADNTISLYGGGGSITSTTQTLKGGDLVLGTSGSSSDDTSDIVWKYGNGNEKARIWADNTYTAAKGLNYRVYKSDGTQLTSGTIPLSNTTYTIATGDSNGQIKVTPSSGSAYNVGVKGLGSAAYKNYAEANTASTVVARNANNYIYATYYNAACGNDNGATSSSYALYVNSDGWLRKCSMSKMYSALGGSGCVQLYTGTLAANNQTTVNYGSYSAYVVICRVDGSAYYYPVVVPKGYITTSAGTEITTLDQYNWMTIQMWYSGSNCYCKCANGTNGNRAIMKIYGLY